MGKMSAFLNIKKIHANESTYTLSTSGLVRSESRVTGSLNPLNGILDSKLDFSRIEN